MSGSDVEHVSGFVDAAAAAAPHSRRLSSPISERFYDALSHTGAHDSSLTSQSSRPPSSWSGTAYGATQQGVSGSQPFALPATVAPHGYPNRHNHRSSPDPDEYYRSLSPILPLEDNAGIRRDTSSLSGTPNPAAEAHPVYTPQQRVHSGPATLSGLSSVDQNQQYRSVSDTFRRGGSDFPSGTSSVRPSAVRSKQSSFKDLINKFNNNVDQVLPIPSVSAAASTDHSRASSPVPTEHNILPGAPSRRRDTGGSTTQSHQASPWAVTEDVSQNSSLHIVTPKLNTVDLQDSSLDDYKPSNLLPRRPLFGELLTVDTNLQGYGIPSHLRRRGSEGSIPSPNPAFLDHFDTSTNQTPLTPTAWYLGRTPFLEAVSTGESSNRHRRTRSDIPESQLVGASTHSPDFDMAVSAPLQPGLRTYLDNSHSKSRIPISSHRLNSPSASGESSPSSPKAQSPVSGRFNPQTPLPPKGSSRLPKPSTKSPRDLVTRGQTVHSTTTTPAPRGRRETGYGRSRTKLADKSPLLEAYIAAPPQKKSPPLRSSRPRQPVSHTGPPASNASKGRVGETVSNLQRQIHRERELRNSRPRERRLPELGNVDFATRRQKIQQAFNRTVKENERREEEAAELRRRASAHENLSKSEDVTPINPEPSELKPVTPEPAAQPDDTATVIDDSADPFEDETQEQGDGKVCPQLHLDTQVPIVNPHATTMDSPTLGHPMLVQEETKNPEPAHQPPASSATSCSEDSPVTTFDPEPQAEISQQDVHTSHRTLLSEIMRIRESSPSSSSCDEQDYGFSDNDDKEPIPILLRGRLGLDDLPHTGPQETSDRHTQNNQPTVDASNRWSMSSWSSSLRNQHSTDGQCDGSGDDLSQLHQSVEDSELATQSCSASSITPSDLESQAITATAPNVETGHEVRQEDTTFRRPFGHSKTPSLAKLGGWDSKKMTQLYLEELARGRPNSLPLDLRASPEPRLSAQDLRADGRTDSLTDDPVMVSKVDGIPASDRLSHTAASLVLRDDWEHASPSIMDWMQIAADDASAPQEQTADASPQNDGAPTPRLVTSNPQTSHNTDGSTGLGLAINIQSPQESEPQGLSIPSMPRHDPPPPPKDAQARISVLQESLEYPHSIQPVQQASETTAFAPLGPVHSTGSSDDSFRQHEVSPSPQARHSSATSLVPSSLEQARPDSSSPSPEQRRLKKRRHVIKELVDTEYTFGRDMKVVDDIYKGTSSSCLDLSAEDIKILFANSDQIVQFSMTFQDALKEAAKSVYIMPKSQRWSSKRSGRSLHASKNDPESSEGGPSEQQKDSATFVGQVFLTHIAHMEKVYAEYLKNHDAANKKLQLLQRSQNVSIWLNECREWASDLTSAWDLDSLLVKPVQRILKYPLLLSELLDSTPPEHPDHASLVKGLEEVTNISVRINEMKRRADVVGQVVGRKRKESDVRMGLSKAFGRRTEKLKQQVGMTEMVADKDYDALAQRFGDNFFQLQVVMRDAEMYTRETQGSLDRFLEFVTAIEGFIDVFQTSYPELEGKWRVFKISVQDIMAATLPEHLDVVRKSVIDPMVALLRLHEGPQRVMKKRDKRLMDYARFKGIKARGDKPDKKTAEQADQFVALNETLKDELPKLYSLTAKLMEACLKNFVQIQTTWYILLQKKIGPLIDSFPEDVQKIVDDWSGRFTFSEAQVLSLGICNGSLLADTANFNTPSAGVSSPRRPSTVHSSSTRAMDESPKASHEFSTSNQSFQSPNIDAQSTISFTRHRADSALSGRPMAETSELPRAQILQQMDSASAVSVPSTQSHPPESFPRLPSLSLDTPFLADVIRPPSNSDAADENQPTPPVGRYSGFFSSAMPMSDNPQEPTGSEANPTKEPAVLFLAASIYEFNIDRARREAGYPYLTYVAGEIFDVIAEKGELWLARNQDDSTHQVGWIWNKHFAKLSA
ncbi:putative Rho guanyl nucleotide exchange factor [Aspergillus stella-maris]|uniref:putative Rho guanyl nucleotide exchange factor n=1 Tax=Aspergillus stella-maris TaxID=1810926 RepID=UPI003CCE4285